MRTATYAGDKPKRLLYFLQGGAFACVVLLLALCGYLLLVAAGWVYRQPVQQVVVGGDLQHIDRGRLRLILLKDLQGQSWLSLSLPALRDSLQTLPWLKNAAISREWPWQLQVVVTERRAVANWGDGSVLAFDGALIATQSGNSLPGLVQLRGPDGAESQVFAEYKTLSPVLQSYGLDITSLALSDAGQWSIVTKSNIIIKLGRDDVVTRLQRVLAALSQLNRDKSAHIKYIDARYPNGLAVRSL